MSARSARSLILALSLAFLRAAASAQQGAPLFAAGFESGSICAWSAAVGWSGPPCTALAITVTIGGQPLAEGALFNHEILPILGATGGTAPVAISATLDGDPFLSGSAVSANGTHTLSIEAEDADGLTANRTVHFAIDTVEPVFISVSPPEGFLTNAPTVVLSGQVSGASSLTVNGLSVALAGELFTTAPLALVEGGQTLLLVASDPAGNATPYSRQIVRDSASPTIQITQPSPGVVGESPVTVVGTASDPHLAEVRVNGVPAALEGSTFSLPGVALAEGANTITATAADAAGNPPASALLSLTLDSDAPELELLESGTPLAAGALFNHAVVLTVVATDATAVTLTITLDGAPFASGSTVQAEGGHTLSATAVDAAGHSTIGVRTFEIDRTAPQFLFVSPPDDSLVGGAEVTLQGEVQGAVSVKVDGAACALAGNAFLCPAVTLAEGERVFELKARDAAGNETPRLHRIRRDGTAPQLLVVTPAADAYLGQTGVTVTGSATDPHLMDVTVNGVLAVVDGASFAAGPIVFAEGAATATVVARDTVGNVRSVERGFHVDTVDPEVAIVQAGQPLLEGALFDHAVVPTIVVTDVSPWTVEAALDGAPFLSGTAVGGEGAHTLVASARDAAGNSTTLQVSFRVDGSAPALVAITPPDGYVTADAEVRLQGRILGAESLTIDGVPVPLVADQFVAGPFSLAEGTRSFLLVSRDAAGNELSVTHRVVRDITAPSISIGAPAAAALVGSSAVQVTGQANDPHLAGVSVNGMAASLSGSTWVAPQVPIAEGDTTLVAVATDRAGNSAQASRIVTRDSQGPVIAILDPAAGTVVPEGSVTVSGSISEPHLDRVTVQGVVATVTGESWAATVPLVEGENRLTARAADRLGHVTEASVAVVRDSTAPGLEIDTPDEGAQIATATVAVAGTTADADVVTVTVNGVSASLANGHYTVGAVPLVEGENRLIARARDAQGNEGARTRTVVRDTVAPTILAVEPTPGALAIELGTSFSIELSERPRPSSATGAHLETASASPIAAAVTIDGDRIRLSPQTPLPSNAVIRLVADSSIADLAGNALAAVETFEFSTADLTPPGAPELDASPPPYVCAAAVEITGIAEPSRWVEALGGSGVSRVRASATGAFALEVGLIPGAIHRLSIRSVDDAGNASAAIELQVVQDCDPPVVESVEAVAGGFDILFNEPIAPSSFAGSIVVTAAGGPVAGSAALSGSTAAFAFDATPPDGPLRVEVLRRPRDLAGNILAFPWVEVFGREGGGSFFVATAIDDATGRPLAGATAKVVSTDGAPVSAPAPEGTSGSDGAVSIAVAPGTHLVAFERPGYTPVFRFVTTQADRGTDVVDPRLSPIGVSAEIGAAGGDVVAASEAPDPAASSTLEVPSGALETTMPISVTQLSGQGLPRLLPYGWSPRGAVWIGGEELDLAIPAELSLSTDATPGSTLVWVHLESASRTWRVEGVTTLGATTLSIPVDHGGAWAAVEADPPPFAVPPPTVGEALGSLPAPPPGGVLSAELTFDPERVLPGQRSLATVDYETAIDAASGTTVTLSIAERLELLDGAIRREAPYRADLVIYRDDGEARSRFHLAPSQAARLLPVEVGEEQVSVLPYGGELVRGNVIGPQGGSVTNEAGDRVDVPAGALTRPTPVSLEANPIASLALDPPAGFEPLGALALGLAGEELLSPASLFLATAEPPPGGASGVLFGIDDLGTDAPAWRPVATISPSGSGWETDPIFPADLPWPGVRRGGAFLFARALQPLGYLRGTVRDVGGDPLALAVIDSPALSWAQFSGSDGRYAFPAWLGPVELRATRSDTGDRGTGLAELDAEGEIVDLDLLLEIVRPAVVSTIPETGANDVPVGVEPAIHFSEPISAASLAGAIELREAGGSPVAIELEASGTQVTVVPEASLAPGTAYELVIGAGVLDLQGHGMEAPVTIAFTTQTIAIPSAVDLSRVRLYEPGANGECRIQGLSGATPSSTLVFAENLSRLAATESTTADPDGSFELSIVGQVSDRILLHVLVPGENEVVAILGPFRTADGRGAYVGPEGATFTTADGWTFTVPSATFAGVARVHVQPRPSGQLPVALPESFIEGVSFALDFGGAAPAKAIELSLPAPAGAPTGRPILVLREMRAAGAHGWMLHELAALSNGRLATLPAGASTPFAAEVNPERFAESAPASATLTPFAGGSPGSMLPGLAFAGNYAISWTPQAQGFLALPLSFGGDVFVQTQLDGIVTVLNASIAALLEGDAILIPAFPGAPVAVTVRDSVTGFVLYEDELAPPPSDGGIVHVPPGTFGDVTPPHPVAGSPLRFFVIEATESGSGDLDTGLSYEIESGTLSIEGESGAAHAEARVRLVSLDGDESVFSQAGSDGAFGLTLGVVSGRRYLLAVGARIDSEDPIEIEWSEALAEELPGIAVRDDEGHTLLPRIERVGDGSILRITPLGNWPVGRTLLLELGPEIADAAGNAWQERIVLEFRAAGSRVAGTYPFTEVHDVARLGSLLFIAAGAQGLAVLDASDPAHLRSVLPGGLTFPWPLLDTVRGVAVDPHGRVIVAGGGTAGFGVVRIFDPLRIPEIAAASDPAAARALAWRGASIVSDRVGGTGTQLPSGTPRKVAIHSDDLRSGWRAGEAGPPAFDISFAPGANGAPGVLSVTGAGAAGGAPVTLRDLTRAAFERVDADASGGFTVAIAARAGDRIELLRNRGSVAYLATLGVGIEAVDVNAFYDGADDPSPIATAVVGIYSGAHDPTLALCNESAADLAGAVIGLGLLAEAGASPPIDVAALVAFRGIAQIESPPSDVGELSFLTDVCAEVEGSRAVRGLATAVDLPWDANGDGQVDATEGDRDYALVSHATGGLLIFDLTLRSDPRLVSRIRLPIVALSVAIDRERMRAYVAGASGGVAVVDLARRAAIGVTDVDGNGVDDRVLEVIPVPGLSLGSSASIEPDLGLIFVGGEGGVASVAMGAPMLAMVTPDGSSRLGEIAPLGVPTRNVGTAEAPREIPASFRLRAAVPGALGAEIRLDLEGVGPGGLPFDDLGATEGLPRTSLAGESGVVLHRLAGEPWQDGYSFYESEEVVAVADPRAAAAYARTARENDPGVAGSCRRCDRVATGVGAGAREILSGDAVRAALPPAAMEVLSAIYEPARLDDGAETVQSVRWETAPSLRQEPLQNPSLGSGDVVPGTLLHSGEVTQGATDLFVRGRGLDFAFARTYRNQGVGDGPLGPGWDFGYRLRLRALPNGDVELYDGRGRRETFAAEGGAYRAPAGRFVDLVKTPGGFLMVDAAHALYRFDEWGRLVSIADAVKDREETGNEIRFHYDLRSRLVSVTDALDRDYDLAYDEVGRLASLTDPFGREVVYGYDGAGRLATVRSPRIEIGEATFPQGLTTTYEYQVPGGDLAARLSSRDNLIQRTDPRGEVTFGVTYADADGDGRAEEATSEEWGGFPLAIAYDFANRKATVDDRRGKLWTYLHAETGQTIRFEDPTGAATTSEIDAEGLVAKVTRPLGGVTEISYDTEGARRSRGNALTVAITANDRGDNGSAHTLTTRTDYESYSNQATRIVDPRGAETVIERNAVGLPKVVTEAKGKPEEGTTKFDYNAFGQLTRLTNPNAHVTAYEYFGAGLSRGYLRQETVDPGGLGIVTSFDADPRGNVTAVTDPRGVRHERTFNEVDWLVEELAAASAATDVSDAPALRYRTRYLHDENGNRVEDRLPFGDEGATFTRVQRQFGVLGELERVRAEATPNAGDFVETSFERDENYNVTTQIEPEGQRTEIAYDDRNQVETLDRGVGSEDAAHESFGYDAEGRRTRFTDGRGNPTQFSFDGFGRPSRTTDAMGNYATTTYDNGSNPFDRESFEAGGSQLASSRSVVDLRGRTKEVRERLWEGADFASARELVTSLQYDAAGALRSVTDPKQRTTLQTLDAAERVVGATDAAGNRTEWDLDAAGNPTARRLIEQGEGGEPATTEWKATFDALSRTASSSDPLQNSSTFTYDSRGNLRLAVDPAGFFTESTYDGLGRVSRTVRPEGVSVDYAYDRSSRLTSYRDALGHTTSYTHDALNRLHSTTYPDASRRSTTYDGAGNPAQETDANGNVTDQIFDALNRMTDRVVALGSGVEGPASESFTYDGLSRLTSTRSGLRTSSRSYDSLSRTLSDGQDGRTVAFDRDDAGNATGVTYPSGYSVTQDFDPLDRLSSAGHGGQNLVSYGFRGPDLVASKLLAGGVAGSFSYDSARRLIGSQVRQGDSVRFSESIDWNSRDLKTAVRRGDLNGLEERFDYDGARRLTGLTKGAVEAAFARANVPGRNAAAPLVQEVPGRSSFVYDAAEAMVSRTEERLGIRRTVPSPSDASGRNRPASIGNETLEWDANGNLKRRGDKRYFWDFRNRLTRVTQDGVGELARYEYDASNRMVKRVAGGESEEFVWSGWQQVEHRKNGQLESRRVYGGGLDEVVREEHDLDGDGTLESVHMPIQDSTGNPVLLLGAAGAPLERRNFSGYGRQTITVDPERPRIEQLREHEGALVLEISEEVLLEKIEAAIEAGHLTLRDTTDDVPVGILATQPVRDGKQRGRRLVLSPEPGEEPAANHGMRLRIEPGAIVDLFDNELGSAYEKDFVWLGADHVIEDTTPPRVELVTAKGGSLRLEFSEVINPIVASAVILLNGATVPWAAESDGYALTPVNAIAATTHLLRVGPALVDLAGNPLADPLQVSVTTGGAEAIAYEAADARIVAKSPAGSVAGMQGAQVDEESGLLYARNRFYDPELGRFISADPLDYVDGPNVYAYARNNPLNFTDPLGLRAATEEDKQKLKEMSQQESSLRKEYFKSGTYQGEKLTKEQYDHAMLDIRRQQTSFIQAVADSDEGLDPKSQIVQSSFFDTRPVESYNKAITREHWEEETREAYKPVLYTVEAPTVIGGVVGAYTAGRQLANSQQQQFRDQLWRGDPSRHNLNVTVREADEVVSRSRFVSGNMTPEEKALGFPRNMLASHTEARAMKALDLKPGQEVSLTGQRPPCPACKGAMTKAQAATGADITYSWRDAEGTQQWRPPGSE